MKSDTKTEMERLIQSMAKETCRGYRDQLSCIQIEVLKLRNKHLK